jgi:hypothetical protein
MRDAGQEEQPSILQTVVTLSNTCAKLQYKIRARGGRERLQGKHVQFQQVPANPSRCGKFFMANPSKLPPEVVSHLRRLAHDLSNSIETIMQASYLLEQTQLEGQGKKWVELIEEAAKDAAHINRELREVLRG